MTAHVTGGRGGQPASLPRPRAVASRGGPAASSTCPPQPTAPRRLAPPPPFGRPTKAPGALFCRLSRSWRPRCVSGSVPACLAFWFTFRDFVNLSDLCSQCTFLPCQDAATSSDSTVLPFLQQFPLNFMILITRLIIPYPVLSMFCRRPFSFKTSGGACQPQNRCD